MKLAILWALSVALIALVITIGDQRHRIDLLTATLNDVLAADQRLKAADDELQAKCDLVAANSPNTTSQCLAAGWSQWGCTRP